MSVEAARPFPWDLVLHLAFRVLRWPPDVAWRATPREIAWALAPFGEADRRAPGRDDLFALMRVFPDEAGG